MVEAQSGMDVWGGSKGKALLALIIIHTQHETEYSKILLRCS